MHVRHTARSHASRDPEGAGRQMRGETKKSKQRRLAVVLRSAEVTEEHPSASVKGIFRFVKLRS